MKLLILSKQLSFALVLGIGLCGVQAANADLNEIRSLNSEAKKAASNSEKERMYRKALSLLSVEEKNDPELIGIFRQKYVALLGLEDVLRQQGKSKEAEEVKEESMFPSLGTIIEDDGRPFTLEEQKAVKATCDERGVWRVQGVVEAAEYSQRNQWELAPQVKAMKSLISLEEKQEKPSANMLLVLYSEYFMLFMGNPPQPFDEYKATAEKLIKIEHQLGFEHSAVEHESDLKRLEKMANDYPPKENKKVGN
jgi:hypothetical protein